MVFQGLLLAGYLYAHKALEGGRYGRLHFALLGLAFVCFPISVAVGGADAPIARLVTALLRAIGLPFLALSTTSTVLQGWHRRAAPRDEAGTYSLYAASNAGSLLALLAYPFAIEPFLTVRAQLWAWMGLYAAFVALHWPLVPPAGRREHEHASVTPAREKLAWLLLALGPSAALLAATNLLTLDFAAVPLLWIVPLAVYLSTFILNFKKNPWYPKRLSLAVVFGMAAWVAAVLVTVLFSADLSDRWQVLRRLWVVNKFVFINACLFILCLICHRSLARSRPRTADAPRYYALIALGGFLGSVLIALVMPVLARRTAMPELDWALAGGLSLAALVYRDWTCGPLEGDTAAASRPALAAVFLLGAAGLAFYVKQSPAFEKGTVYSLRNFYGYYRVVDKDGFRRFFHGNTMHGIQSLDPKLRDEPLSYFHRDSPIGEALTALHGDFHRVGILGLGVGILAAYGEKGQTIDYFELDPDVIRIARDYFTFMKDSAADVSAVPGDARLSLSQARGRYDLIVLDAFTGGAIPVHMLTREAFDLYESKLNDGGVIAAHITNRFLNLRPELAAMAKDRGLLVAAKQSDLARLREEKYYSSWVLLSRDRVKIDRLRAKGWQDLSGERPVRVWTDGYASLLSALKS
jgi:spermidine synthase